MPSNHMGEIVIGGGRFFGHYNNPNFVPNLADRFPQGGIASTWCDRPRARPAIDLVYGDITNSPTQPVLIESGPYRNQMLIGELTGGGIRRACMEQVNGQWQGAVFQFSQGFSVGINRLAWGPGGVLMAGGIGAGGNWNWKEKRSGLDRLTPTGKLPFEYSAIRAMPDGFDVQFTGDIDTKWLANPANYTIKQWDYEPNDQYGGVKKHVETLSVAEAKPTQGESARRVFIRVPGLKEGRTVLIRTDPVSTSGEQIWSTEAFYTLNHIPRIWSSGPAYPEPYGVGAVMPRDATMMIGRSARSTFSTPKETGKDIETGRTQKDIMASGWQGFTDVGSGDLLSRASFGDCRLHVEWYAPPGGEGQQAGNSGIYLQDRYEVQVLGTHAAKPGDKPLDSNEAGSVYRVRPPDVNASTGPGTWQAYDILFTAPRFKDGKKVSNARLTLYWNGVLVHRDAEVSGPTGSAAAKGESADGRLDGVQIGRLRLQAHSTDAEGPVRYRNMWIAPLDAPHNEPKHGPWLDLFADGESGLSGFVIRGGNATYRIETPEGRARRTRPAPPLPTRPTRFSSPKSGTQTLTCWLMSKSIRRSTRASRSAAMCSRGSPAPHSMRPLATDESGGTRWRSTRHYGRTQRASMTRHGAAGSTHSPTTPRHARRSSRGIGTGSAYPPVGNGFRRGSTACPPPTCSTRLTVMATLLSKCTVWETAKNLWRSASATPVFVESIDASVLFLDPEHHRRRGRAEEWAREVDPSVRRERAAGEQRSDRRADAYSWVERPTGDATRGRSTGEYGAADGDAVVRVPRGVLRGCDIQHHEREEERAHRLNGDSGGRGDLRPRSNREGVAGYASDGESGDNSTCELGHHVHGGGCGIDLAAEEDGQRDRRVVVSTGDVPTHIDQRGKSDADGQARWHCARCNAAGDAEADDQDEEEGADELGRELGGGGGHGGRIPAMGRSCSAEG